METETNAADRFPSLTRWAGLSFTVLFLGSVMANFMITEGASYPTPYRPLEELLAHYSRFADAQRVTGFLQFAASIMLGLFAATVTSGLRRLRVHLPSVSIAYFGGMGASLFLGISALASWVLSQPGVASEVGSMRAMQLTAFASGGVGHTAALGLLLAGVSVPALRLKLMPRWVCWLGIAVAVVAELSTLSLLSPALSPLLPLARFPSLVWLIAAGFTLSSAGRRSPEVVGAPGN